MLFLISVDFCTSGAFEISVYENEDGIFGVFEFLFIIIINIAFKPA